MMGRCPVRSAVAKSEITPEYGDPVTVRPGEVPVFWACGVTPQAVALASQPEFMITHEPDIAAHAKRIIHIKDGKLLKDEKQKSKK